MRLILASILAVSLFSSFAVAKEVSEIKCYQTLGCPTLIEKARLEAINEPTPFTTILSASEASNAVAAIIDFYGSENILKSPSFERYVFDIFEKKAIKLDDVARKHAKQASDYTALARRIETGNKSDDFDLRVVALQARDNAAKELELKSQAVMRAAQYRRDVKKIPAILRSITKQTDVSLLPFTIGFGYSFLLKDLGSEEIRTLMYGWPIKDKMRSLETSEARKVLEEFLSSEAARDEPSSRGRQVGGKQFVMRVIDEKLGDYLLKSAKISAVFHSPDLDSAVLYVHPVKVASAENTPINSQTTFTERQTREAFDALSRNAQLIVCEMKASERPTDIKVGVSIGGGFFTFVTATGSIEATYSVATLCPAVSNLNVR